MTGAVGEGGGVRQMHLAVQLPRYPGPGGGARDRAGAREGIGARERIGGAARTGGARERRSSALDFGGYARLARTAERGLFDFLLLPTGIPGPEPVTVLNALAGVTERLGLVATAGPDGYEPDRLARGIAALDRLSAGRAGGPAVAVPTPGREPGPQGAPVVIREEGGAEPAEVVLAASRGLARPGVKVLARFDFTREGFAEGDLAEADAALALAGRLDAPVQSGALDGYVLLPDPAVGGRGLDAFVERVVPLLQQRGSLRTAYRGSTLREHLGLPFPVGKG